MFCHHSAGMGHNLDESLGLLGLSFATREREAGVGVEGWEETGRENRSE